MENKKTTSKEINEKYIQAIRDGDINLIKVCVKKGADIHYQEDMALDTATRFDNLEVLKFLVEELKLDPKINFRCIRDAATHNNMEMLKYLVESCQVDSTMKDNCAINCAIMADKLEAMIYLQSHGANPNVLVMESSSRLEPENPSLIEKPKKPYLQHKNLNSCWIFASVNCMQELLPDYKHMFFSKENIKEELTASNIVSKLETNPVFTNYVIKELISYDKKKLNLIKSTRDKIQGSGDITSQERQEKFDKWCDWIEMDQKFKDKPNTKNKMKI